MQWKHVRSEKSSKNSILSLEYKLALVLNKVIRFFLFLVFILEVFLCLISWRLAAHFFSFPIKFAGAQKYSVHLSKRNLNVLTTLSRLCIPFYADLVWAAKVAKMRLIWLKNKKKNGFTLDLFNSRRQSKTYDISE